MKSRRFVTPALMLALSVLINASPVFASVRGFDQPGNPWTGLQTMVAILLAIVAFTILYIFMDRFEQRRINRMIKNRDVDGLIRSLRSPWLSTKAARALGEAGDERAVEPLIKAMNCKSAETREAVADALGRIGDERAIEKLNAALADSYVSVREHARSSLEQIRRRTDIAGH